MNANPRQVRWLEPMPKPIHAMPRALRRRWRWAVAVLLLSLAGGLLLACFSTPQYLAKATIRLLGGKPLTIFDETSGGQGDADTAIRVQYRVLHSPRILSVVAGQLNLTSAWKTDLTGAVDRLSKKVLTRRISDHVVELRVRDGDPQLAAGIANAIVQTYASQANLPRQEQAKFLLERLNRQCDEQAKVLSKAEQDIQSLRQELGLGDGSDQQASAALNPLRQLAAQAEADAVSTQVFLEALMQCRKDPALALQYAAAGDSAARILAARFTEAQSLLSGLEQRYGPNHPRVVVEKKNLEAIRKVANEHVDRLIAKAQTDYAAAELRAQGARQRLAAARQSLVSPSSRYAELLAAAERLEVQRNLLKLLTERSRKLAVELEVSPPAAQIIEPASVPVRPAFGSAWQILLIAMGMGLASGIFVALLVDRLDDSVREPDELPAVVNLPVINAVGNNTALLDSSSVGATAEAYRMIRNSVDFADHAVRVLCITAAGRNEGATTTIANLAWTWAEHGARVLLVDADLANPSAHRLFGLSGDFGLIDYFRGAKSLEELLTPTSLPNVYIVPAGGGASAENRKVGLLAQSPPPITPQKLADVLCWARDRADIVLVDAGPILQTSDAAIIARHSDATIFVVRQMHTPAHDIRRAAYLLAGSGAKLLGVVMTGVADGATWDPVPRAWQESYQQPATESRADQQKQSLSKKYAA